MMRRPRWGGGGAKLRPVGHCTVHDALHGCLHEPAAHGSVDTRTNTLPFRRLMMPSMTRFRTALGGGRAAQRRRCRGRRGCTAGRARLAHSHGVARCAGAPKPRSAGASVHGTRLELLCAGCMHTACTRPSACTLHAPGHQHAHCMHQAISMHTACTRPSACTLHAPDHEHAHSGQLERMQHDEGIRAVGNQKHASQPARDRRPISLQTSHIHCNQHATVDRSSCKLHAYNKQPARTLQAVSTPLSTNHHANSIYASDSQHSCTRQPTVSVHVAWVRHAYFGHATCIQ
eukprot:361902-Chlamydomonas_euryale.AAC.7